MAESEGQAADHTRAAGELIAAGPEGTGRPPGTSMRGALRGSLLRLLKPYTAYQRMVDERVLAAVDELDARVATVERIEPLVEGVTEALEAMRSRVQRAEESVERLSGFYDPARSLPYMAADSPFELRDVPVAGRVMGFVGGANLKEGEAYRTFEDVFRGPESRVRELQEPYLELLGDREPVLDAGCGRGEFLDLLKKRGIRAIGVDSDPGMVEHCHAKGHGEVVQADVNEYLADLPDGELGAVFSAQVIEHIPYADLTRFLERSREKLQPGGLFIAETVNPHAPEALKTFWVDPTHQHPLFPEVALALCRAAGYESAYVFHPGGLGDIERDRYTCTAYAVVATK